MQGDFEAEWDPVVPVTGTRLHHYPRRSEVDVVSVYQSSRKKT